MRIDATVRIILMVIALGIGVIAFRPLFATDVRVSAQAAKFDHVMLLATSFLYKGQQGVLVLDRRNGNVWFIPRTGETFLDPSSSSECNSRNWTRRRADAQNPD